MSDAEIIDAVRLHGYPDDLTDDEIVEAIKHSLRELQREYPLIQYGTFHTVQNQFIYDLFNPVQDTVTQQGMFPGGLRAFDLVWNSQGSGSSLDIFGTAPLLQGLSIIPNSYTRNSFYTPSDWTIWDLNWSAFMHRFNPMEWEHVESRPGSPIRLYGGPNLDGGLPVYIRYGVARTLDQIRDEDESWFLMFVEAQCCFTLANKFSCAAGVEFQGVKDSGILRAHWATEGRRKYDEAWRTFEKRKIDGVRAERRWH